MDNMDWTFSLATEVVRNQIDPLKWRKQALYVGAKPVLADGSTREITEDDIDTFVSNGKARLAAGIKHPLPVGHTTDDEANRGWVTMFEKGTDSKGRVSLYLGGTVRDEDAAKTLKANDISIFAPREDKVGGRTWTRSIKHAAITSYPRVKDLDSFALALSEGGGCDKCKMAELRLMEEKPEPDEPEDTPTFADHIRNLRRHGLRSRGIIEAMERLNNPALVEAVKLIDIPDNRFSHDDYQSIDGTAFALAEEHGKAYLVRDGDDVLVLSEAHVDAYRVMTV